MESNLKNLNSNNKVLFIDKVCLEKEGISEGPDINNTFFDSIHKEEFVILSKFNKN